MTTDPRMVQNLFKNAQVLTCDWAIVFYQITDATIMNQICSHNFSPFKLIHCQPSATTLPMIIDTIQAYGQSIRGHPSLCPASNCNTSLFSPMVNKISIYYDLLPLLPRYSKILLMDADISYRGYNITEALRMWECTAKYPPLVVQPLIRGHTDFAFVISKKWKKKTPILIHSTLFLEQQTPWMDTRFLSWFLRHVVKELLSEHLVLGSSWGIDSVWCKAALDYGRHVLQIPGYNISCAIITGLPGVRHLDLHSINKTVPFWKARNTLMNALYKDRFPFYYEDKKLYRYYKDIWRRRKYLPSCSSS